MSAALVHFYELKDDVSVIHVGIFYNLLNKIYITHFLELIILVHTIDSGRQEYVRYQGKKIDSYVAGSIVY